MAKPKINVTIAPPPPKAGKGPTAVYNQFINQHPVMRPYADTISSWAKAWGVDKVVAASLFWRESFAVATSTGASPDTITSPSGAGVGIGQINPIHVGSATPWGSPLTESDLTDPAKNIEWSLWFFKQQMDKFGNVDDAYSKGYNPGYTGPALTTVAPHGYVPEGGLSPTQKADVTVQGDTALAQAKELAHASDATSWMVVQRSKGRIVGLTQAYGPEPPKDVLKIGGVPQTKTDVQNRWDSTYDSVFQAFTGRVATAAEVVNTLTGSNGTVSVYQLKKQLAASPDFVKSPVYQQKAAAVQDYVKQTLGKVPKGFVADALVNDWDQAEIDARVRQLPAYESGPKYKSDYAQIENVYKQIYGNPPGTAEAGGTGGSGAPPASGQQASPNEWIKNAALNGWTQDAAAAALRNDPAYKFSPEYQSKAVNFLDAMGMFTGARPILTAESLSRVKQETAGSKVGGAPLNLVSSLGSSS